MDPVVISKKPIVLTRARAVALTSVGFFLTWVVLASTLKWLEWYQGAPYGSSHNALLFGGAGILFFWAVSCFQICRRPRFKLEPWMLRPVVLEPSEQGESSSNDPPLS